MVPWLWKGLVGVGLFALAHAAFSAAQHHSHARLTEEGYESLPADIVLQTLLAFAVTCYGVVHTAGEFKDRDATSELRKHHGQDNLEEAFNWTYGFRGLESMVAEQRHGVIELLRVNVMIDK
ncbi:hypothetical protein U0070_026641 [Myodes glareolus]|uniref:Membrane magnesium transporter n=1 Tax=Myodes glareolus TaxID=447135 RepID=A0AAW0JKT0_MYOGA